MASGRQQGGSRVWTIVFRLSLAVLVVAVGLFGLLEWSYVRQERAYEDIAARAFDAGTGTMAKYTIDWDYLRSINPDVVAWIYIPDTVVNYPVAYSGDNDYYLATDFNGDTGLMAHTGTIFLDGSNKPDFSDLNNVLYGHHMKNGSMFACLSEDLADNDTFNACRNVYVLTPTMNYRCMAFSLVLTTGWDPLAQTSFSNPAEWRRYLADMESRSAVDPDGGMPDPAGITKTFMLSTCDYTQDNGRAVLFAQVVEAAKPDAGAAGDVENADDYRSILDAVPDAG